MNRNFPFDDDDMDPFSMFGGRRGGSAQRRPQMLMDNMFQDFHTMGSRMNELDRMGGFGGFGGFGGMSGFEEMSGNNGAFNSSFSSYSYSSSSTGNGPPVVVKKSVNESRRPGGVVERKEQFEDSRSNTAGISVSRRIGDRGRAVAKIKEAGGQEKTFDTLHNIDETTMDSFDRDWNRMSNGLSIQYDEQSRSPKEETVRSHPRVELLEDDTVPRRTSRKTSSSDTRGNRNREASL
mmetsp:Transcript_35533/g.36203  ORF Transcript_35533/g.36203 Transcript_35533/m.36203 type:complete len:236 (+) Transcript_35533:63-770(+)|eukprot:CAMPEP_0182427522 /NCGR_PEP_ID=MMETSP1167-20130531/18148_1 /TAXON_ID=2988 /ORGANISM="Mallomonas Sp, Strain CCMP3275" /LENGTH=235 /DNA_ID=CAMNT_0024609827 /DNA_START=52 /DNA_END=759 /DNA_ORIENTATION=+